MILYHQPVLLKQVTDILKADHSKTYIDATLGHAGHTIELLKTGATVYGFDADPQYLEIATKRIKSLHLLKNFHPILTNFSKISDFIKQPVDGILFDLGLNNHQLISSSRGFSFNDNTSLDMRLDPSVDGLTAEYIINTYDFQQLTTIFSKYSQEKFSKDIASEIIKQRQHAPIKTAVRLAEIISKIYQQHQFKSPHHPATKVFLSLRIAVNQEFENLNQALNSTLNINKNCIVIIISFHSGEDRIVKQFIKQNHLHSLTPHPIRPTFEEIKHNPLARSAILRSFTT